MAGAEGFEPSTYGFGDPKSEWNCNILDGARHRFATRTPAEGSDDPETVALVVVGPLNHVTVSVQGGLDVGVAH